MSNPVIRILARIKGELKRLTRTETEVWPGKGVSRSIERDVDEKLDLDRRGRRKIEETDETPGGQRTTGASHVDDIPPPRLIDRSVPGEQYLVEDTAHRRFIAMGQVGRHGELLISIRNQLETGQRSTLLKGSEQFRAILGFFEGKFTSIHGNWQFGTNLARFNELTAQGLSPEVAAARTWTGQQAADAGFRSVRILHSQGEPGKYTSVKVEYTP